MAALTATLFGDPELDRCVPLQPRVIPEIQWAPVDGGRIMAVTGLRPILFPRKLGAIELVDFLPQLDGSVACQDLLTGPDDVVQDRTAVLRCLFRSGLLEEKPLIEHPAVPPATRAFLAFSRDLTRLCRSRDESLARAVSAIGVVGAPPELLVAFAELGLQPRAVGDVAAAAGLDLIVAWVDGGGATDAFVQQLQDAGRMVLLVAGRDDALDIGPLIAGSGYGSVADYRTATSDRPYLVPADDLVFWSAIAAQAAFLVLTRSSPLPLTNKCARFTFDREEGVHCETVPIPKAGASVARRGLPLCLAAQERILRQARLSVPPIYLAGTKMHEVHYARKNVAATLEIPLASGREPAPAGPPAATSWFTRLLELLDAVWGYTRHLDGHLSRNCPSGGNLGTPECLVVLSHRGTGAESIYRFIPVERRLELVLGDEPSPAASRGSGYALTIVSIGNREKAQRKYDEFGLNLVQLDAGVTRAFFERAARACGFDPRPPARALPLLGELVDDRRETCLVSWQTDLRACRTFPFGVFWTRRLAAFKRLAKARSALRRFAGLRLSRRVITALVAGARPPVRGKRQASFRSAVRVIVTLTGPGAGTYELGRGRLRPIGGVDGPRLQDNVDVIVQRALAEAPGRLFFFVDLARLMASEGATVHDELLQFVGEWVGGLWLDLERIRHGGCPAGAASESEILSCLPPEYRDLTLLFTFVFGRRP